MATAKNCSLLERVKIIVIVVRYKAKQRLITLNIEVYVINDLSYKTLL